MTVFICHYGCGRTAIKQNKSGNWMCDTSPNKCPENKRKNSQKTKEAYSSGKRVDQKTQYKNLPDETKRKIAWSTGLTKETNENVRRISELNSITKKGKKGTPHTEEFKKRQRENRFKIISEGKYDSSGRKGHRGHYDGVYFHSSWELAYYIWSSEILKQKLQRNKNRIKYLCDDIEYEYIPDFVTLNSELIEIKGYLWSDRDNQKYLQTKDKVKYLFKEDLKESIEYCKSKYGNRFWEVLYG